MWCCWFCSSDFHEKCRMIAAALSLLLKSLGLNGGGGTCARRAHSLSFSPIHFQQPVMLRSPFRDQTNWLMTLMSAAVSGQSRSKKVPRKTFPPPSPLPPPSTFFFQNHQNVLLQRDSVEWKMREKEHPLLSELKCLWSFSHTEDSSTHGSRQG